MLLALNYVSFASIAFKSGKSKPENWGSNQSYRLLDRWYPPPPGWIKLNVDASLLKSYKAGAGGVIRDCKGRFILIYGHSCIHWDISQLELLAVQILREIKKDYGRVQRVDY
ncbi:hypothetical protein KFK09_014176 [Dendrobium nobile]|uniref:RNase H type-1 domain-containing protein n=1 Tax=Dendrobium nobile TaxID=94219 RepID=A0A8T3BBT6_DENNO|nr:hypothetical protein KFK09_014176 [Dendrobium nobile]